MNESSWNYYNFLTKQEKKDFEEGNLVFIEEK
jgi:hypothetical protein